MSSIDKNVETIARECNPKVRVVNKNGRIEVYIGNDKVFDIADRVGYLTKEEKNSIQDSIRAYERQEEERKRLSAIQLENQRVAVRTELKRNITLVRSQIQESYNSANRIYSRAAQDVKYALDSKLPDFNEYNISSYIDRVQRIKNQIDTCGSGLNREYNKLIDDLRKFESGVNDNASTSEFERNKNELRKIKTNVSAVDLPLSQIDTLVKELDDLAKALVQVKKIEAELKNVPKTGLSGSIAESAIYAIHNKNISSISDVTNLMSELMGKLEEIKKIELQNQVSQTADRISVLDGLISSCSELREYTIKQHYESKSYRSEIVETANNVFDVYSELRDAEYTTCSDERISEVMTIAQEVLNDVQSDEETLNSLKKLLNEGERYKQNDNSQAENYVDYKKKVDELITRGYAFDEIEAFDSLGYDKQKLQLIELLIKQDKEVVSNRTRLDFLTACEVMEKMGYSPLYMDMGTDEDKSDALACEAIYVIPGCDGVVMKITSSNGEIGRKLIGIKRASNGKSTTVERVREVARRIEESGEIEDYFGKYADAMGDSIEVTSGVDTDSENSDETIIKNGCFALSEEGERIFDEINGSASEDDIAKWRTKVPVNTHNRVIDVTCSADERKELSKKCSEEIERARRS